MTLRFSRGYERWLLTVLVATYACAFIDRIIVATIGPAIIRDLNLSDLQFGLLGGLAFALFYSVFGLPVARLAERWNRVNIIAFSVALWSGLTVMCGLTSTYWQLLLCRLGVGIGEAGCTPPAQSLISDHFPAKQRASALSVYMIGVPIGATLGAVGGGWIAQTFGWRAAFLVAGAPGLLLALLVKLTLREPPRGHAGESVFGDDTPPLSDVLRQLWSRPAFVHVFAGCSLTTLAATGINLFAPLYFVRRFGMSMAEVGLLYGLVLGTGTSAGLLLGGFGVDLGAKRDIRWYGWGPAAGALLGTPLYLWAYSRPTAASSLVFVLLGGLSVSIYLAPSFALAQNLVQPRMRASAAALLLLSMNVIGQGIGPTVMGLVSDMAASKAFTLGNYASLCLAGGATGAVASGCAEAAATGLQRSLMGVSLFFLWGALHYALAVKSLRQDLAGAYT